MQTLGSLAAGRNNNLNLIRAIAAIAVLVSHGWPMVLGPDAAEPLQRVLGYNLGTLSVFVFFAISGFLISSSFTRSDTLQQFIRARIARLFPGLIVSLLLVALVMGPLVSTWALSDYFGTMDVWRFLASNLLLVVPQYTLPGVFEANPYPTVEGSIWSLAHEVGWYGVVFVLGIGGALQRRWGMAGLSLLLAVLWLVTQTGLVAVHPKIAVFIEVGLPFMAGMVLFAWRDRVVLSGRVALGLAIPASLVVISPLALPLLIAALAYGTFYLAYVPGGWLRQYNRVGDFSYGIYIYAFPVQGLVMWMFHPATVAAHIALALPPTIVLAMLSWVLVERPALHWLRARPARLPRGQGQRIHP